MKTNLLARFILRQVLALAGMGVALFWAAGRLDWWGAWGALAIQGVWEAGMTVIVARDPELLAQRMGHRPGAKTWDTAIVSSLGLVTLLRYITAGLDARYGWSGDFPVAAQAAAFVLGAFGNDFLFVWAAASNRFFSEVLRVQSERGHAVVSAGPYRWLRHPAYAGALLYELTASVLLGSWWSMIFSAVSSFLLILRTALEDRTLQAELPGYADYARRVRARLLPGVW
jgi:protein-S-isoprenylcysteine O-methyltransferase Ste14